jgi:hypothetical protein
MKFTIALLSLLTFTLFNVGAAHGQSEPVIKSKATAITEVTAVVDKLRCLDDDEAMEDCLSFIKGFLQGALLTDTAIIKSIDDAEPTLAERAFKTRLGTRATSPTALAGFCLPERRTVLDIAEETLDHVKGSERNSVQLASNVYSSLKTDYPCE